MKVRFIQDRTGEDYTFKSGECYDLPDTSAERWIKRGAAKKAAPNAKAADSPSNKAIQTGDAENKSGVEGEE